MSTISRPVKAVLNLADTLDCRGSQWSNNVYFQIITGIPLLHTILNYVERWNPVALQMSALLVSQVYLY